MRLAAIERVHGLRRVFDDEQPMRPGDLPNAVHLASDSRVVHGNDHFGSLGEGRLDQILVEVQRVGTDVDEDRPRTGPHKGARRGHKRKGGQDDLIARLEIAE